MLLAQTVKTVRAVDTTVLGALPVTIAGETAKNPLRWRLTPVLIAVALIVATAALWRSVARQEQAHFTHVVRLATEGIRADIEDDVQRPIDDLSRIADLWHQSSGPTRQQFETHSSLFISRDPGCLAVAWVSPSPEIVWSVAADGDDGAQQLYLTSDAARRAGELARATRRSVLSRASLYHNRRLLSIWAPIYVENKYQGAVVGLFRIEPFLNSSLADSDFGYSVVISEGGEPPFYSLHATGVEQERSWGESTHVTLPGVDWTVRVWPENGPTADVRSASNGVLLGGFVLALLAALITYLAQKAHEAARVSDQTNRQLSKEVVARRRAEESLHALSGRLLKVQDEERQNLARILHEGMAQKLFGLSMNLKLVSRLVESHDPSVVTRLQQNIDLADECVCEMRALTHLLHPPSLDVLGLVAACETLVQGFAERTGLEVFTDFPEELARLPQDSEMALFRILQESLTNVQRHSASRSALVRLHRHEDLLVLEVKDFGRGMPQDAGEHGVGIPGMRERMWQLGGELQVDSTSGGVTIRALLPIAALTENAAVGEVAVHYELPTGD